MTAWTDLPKDTSVAPPALEQNKRCGELELLVSVQTSLV